MSCVIGLQDQKKGNSRLIKANSTHATMKKKTDTLGAAIVAQEHRLPKSGQGFMPEGVVGNREHSLIFLFNKHFSLNYCSLSRSRRFHGLLIIRFSGRYSKNSQKHFRSRSGDLSISSMCCNALFSLTAKCSFLSKISSVVKYVLCIYKSFANIHIRGKFI